MTATNRVMLAQLRSQLNSIGKDREYLNSTLINSYAEKNELQANMERLTSDANTLRDSNRNYIQFVTNILEISRVRDIDSKLLLLLLEEHGIL